MNLFRRRPKPDAWPLRPGDLPPEWILRREPRLRGLEENAFFRLLHSVGRKNSVSRSQLNESKSSPLERWSEEIALLPVSLDEIANAYWGYALAEGPRTVDSLFFGVLWPSFASIALAEAVIEAHGLTLLPFSAMFFASLGYVMAIYLAMAERGLQLCLEFVAARRRHSISPGIRKFVGFFLGDIWLCALTPLPAAALVQGALGGALGVIVYTILAAGFGASLGAWRMRRIRRNRDRYLKKLADDLGFILERRLEARDRRRGADVP